MQQAENSSAALLKQSRLPLRPFLPFVNNCSNDNKSKFLFAFARFTLPLHIIKYRKMKKITLFLLVAIGAMTLFSCNNSETYADKKNKERRLINDFDASF